MKHSIWLLALVLPSAQLTAQKKADRKTLGNLQTHISYLASDKLEGRLTGSPGEQLAASYISAQMKQAGLTPKGDNGYLQTFPVNEGKTIGPSSSLTINNNALTPVEQYIPLPFSAQKSAKGDVMPAVNEPDNIWLLNVKDIESDPHTDPLEIYHQAAAEAAKAGATGVVFYNGPEAAADVLKWLSKETTPLTIPVMWVTDGISKTMEHAEEVQVSMNVVFGASKRTGTNVIGFLDNKAPATIIIGAHFDHLGKGEDHNSLTPNDKSIHNGADDNASGTAALIELARLLKGAHFNKYNFLFTAFSGEELGLFGSKYLADHPPVQLESVDYMINMDMIGRLDTSKGLQVGGVGTSPVWPEVLKGVAPAGLKLTFDSSGTGPSDHTSFYLKNIPVLFFFTGSHADYHKPSDDADRINYNGEVVVLKMVYDIVEKTNGMTKLAFTKTKDKQMGTSARFSVTLGIMPDYTWQKNGVHVDAVTEGKTAYKAGLAVNDIIIKLGNHTVANLEDYMQALASFKKGDKTTVWVKRGAQEKKFDIQF
ncbi:M20/M25/M40 family metallo-hydrolase [Chitinophaga sancti]|uniref:M20/M25/M40 family metallo-hydrolase n=1 Tax=Chitinophaga sancti TaxID=1004 RepID=UPI002A74E6CC|nr:M20/M25/M40 family metallo-hydrolase [Chitinophaga sancti]WPQ64106.1 M20/M25/M40 family metallo-hydrolase [Chitinophaga sancti]